ncbi:GntR family transcriptional regulator [Cryobacterium sp. PH29-G1]|uniref:GntR family transcriptional regulator n=1 Tax=Cryobacterium sp. PH29-G1 TaxID=3046211 RepID=UPI0024BA8248|nr:GntR family transcriptional regulator [Cryobacterium sp. PH29-G1]MDJ0349838.1 GntR family transcriptional regulator [Cryobacterium sp. PH29-G1]
MTLVYTETAMLGLDVPLRASERAYRQLRGEILDGVLAPGTALLEVEQAERIGVSRTPLREAVARLIADGLVVGRRGRGFEVTEISVDSISELYELRQALEVQAIRLAATRRDPAPFIALREEFRTAPGLLDQGDIGVRRYYVLIDELEDAIDLAVENPFLVGALRAVRTHLARIRRLARRNPLRLLAAAAEHLLIIDAIIAGDPSLAAHATHIHLHQSLVSVLAAIDEEPAL